MCYFPFDAKAVDYSKRNAYSLAKCSQWAYDGKRKVQTNLQSCGLQLHEYLQDPDTGTEGFVAYDAEKVIVAFRGTQEPTDYLTNARVTPREWQNVGFVHSGFGKGVDSVWKQLTKALDAPHLEGLPLWMTGHSLGGALATLAAAWGEINEGRPIAGLYTFGCPRVGDPQEFYTNVTKKLGDRIYRVVHEPDVVPQVPPEDWGKGYKHVGIVELFHADGAREEQYGAWVTTKSILAPLIAGTVAVVAAWVAAQWKACAANHSIDTYVRLTGRECPPPGTP